MRTESELRALVVLLGDEQERVWSVAWEAMMAAGPGAVPHLEAAELSADPVLRGRARLLLDEMRRGNMETAWRSFAERSDHQLDLEEGCLLLSRLAGVGSPDTAAPFLDAISGMVRAHMVSVGGAQALSEVLFDNLGFRGGDFEDPRCHYLAGVLERRAGIPISLATVYVLVGRRAGLPVSGVAMPGHYLARFEHPDGPVFVDCYSRGRQYRYETLADLLTGKGLSFSDEYLAPTTTRFTLFRMLNNLERLHQSAGDERMTALVQRWRGALGIER